MTSRSLQTIVLVLSLATSARANTPVPLPLDDLFPGVESTLAVVDVESGRIAVHNGPRAATPFVPASTFKIANSLISLETGVATGVDHLRVWDGTKAPRAPWWPESWTRSQTLASAFSNSVVWYYQELAREVGSERMHSWLKRLDYGNGSIGGGIDRFWLDGELRISALEQVGFLRRLQSGELPVGRRSQQLVLEMMKLGEAGGFQLCGKTGTADLGRGRELGWLVGLAERGGRRFAFAMNIEGERVWEEWPRQKRIDAVAAALSRAEPLLAGGRESQVAKRFTATLTRTAALDYLLHVPEQYAGSAESFPLILYLHGGSLRGKTLDDLRRAGLPAVAEADPAFPFLVVSPLLPAGEIWSDTHLILGVVDEVMRSHRVDRNRVFVTGHSMGGRGALYLAWKAPERFAGVVAISPYSTIEAWAKRLAQVPLRLIHGARDEIVPLREIESLARAIETSGGAVQLTVLPDRDHYVLDLYEDRSLYSWMLAPKETILRRPADQRQNGM